MFRETWLDQYMRQASQTFFVARSSDGAVLGYLAGSFQPPGREAGFTGQHHVSVFRDLWERFPAHFHINIAPTARAQGLGARLVAAFVAACATEGVAGVHIVTGREARNARFYRRQGLTHEVCRDVLERRLLFMGRAIGSDEDAKGHR